MLIDSVRLKQINRVLFKIWAFVYEIFLGGASFNKSHGASYNTIKLILENQSDIKRHFAFLYSLKFCQTFILNTNFLFPEHGLSIADDILNIQKVLCIWMEPVCSIEKSIEKRLFSNDVW